MARLTVISGSIEVPHGSDAGNEALIAAFAFDPVWPFTKVFSAPRPGYRDSSVSFAAFATGAEPLGRVLGGRPCARFPSKPGRAYGEEVELCL